MKQEKGLLFAGIYNYSTTGIYNSSNCFKKIGI